MENNSDSYKCDHCVHCPKGGHPDRDDNFLHSLFAHFVANIL